MRALFLAWILLMVAGTAPAFDAVPARGQDLSGHWQLNQGLSDDVEQMLQRRFDKEAQEHARRMQARRRAELAGELVMPEYHPPRSRPSARENERIRRVLNISRTLHIVQDGARLEIASEVETRRFVGGVRSQVSMPGGGLADSRVGWKGQWFVIDRRVRGGIRVVERYRWLAGGDRLESELKVSGDDFLAGMKVRRIYERTAPPSKPPELVFGPVP
ncbi:MAG: hypothetical protein DIU71_11625 [Proteobacteria bacterium]|nr:MAG: hypothetical protein DIU71_11625 [Pseudomonadota bacterium]